MIDIRHDPQAIDMEFMEWMGTQQIPFSIIFTKADKMSENKIYPTVSAYLNVMLEGIWAETPTHFITSASSSKGKEEVLEYVESML
mgnify:FL=1